MIETKIPTEVPLPLLKAHAELAAACDDWQAAWTAKAVDRDAPPEVSPPRNPNIFTTEVVCEVAQRPKASIDAIEAQALNGLLAGLVFGGAAGVILYNAVIPGLAYGLESLRRHFLLWRSRRTPT